MLIEEYKKIIRLIDMAENILISGHIKHDADSLSSVLAMSDWLWNKNKQVHPILHEKPADGFNFLKNISKIDSEGKWLGKNFDLIIVMDTGSLERANLTKYKDHKIPVINIDHHQGTLNFGQANIVDANCSSTAELIFDFLQYVEHPIDKDLATTLLAGIGSDTELFYNSVTNAASVKKASHLLELGADLPLISKKIFKQRKIEYLKFLGEVLERVEFNPKFKILYSTITNNDLEKFNLTDDEAFGISNLLKNTLEGEITLLLKEMPGGKIKGSLRSKNVNIEPLARVLGGGGHNKASGFVMNGKLVQTEKGWRVE